MLQLYSGTPGSGKSLHVIRDIDFYIECGCNVISNFPVRCPNPKKKGMLKKYNEHFFYMENKDMTSEFFINFALKYHKKGKEGQTLIVFDEAQSIFNPRDFSRADRRDYLNFFPLHRHLGYDVILVTPNDRMLDRQIRALLEYEVKHRKVNNFKGARLLPIKVFIAIKIWYGIREKVDVSFFTYRKKWGRAYDSYCLFDILEEKLNVKFDDSSNSSSEAALDRVDAAGAGLGVGGPSSDTAADSIESAPVLDILETSVRTSSRFDIQRFKHFLFKKQFKILPFRLTDLTKWYSMLYKQWLKFCTLKKGDSKNEESKII